MYRLLLLNPIRSIFYLIFSILLITIFIGKASAQGAQAQIILTPDKQSVDSGQKLNITVKIDTAGNKINTFQAYLNYPADKLDFVSIDTSKSPFKLVLESEAAKGKVKMIQGAVDAQTGQPLAGVINFKAKAKVSADSITVSNDSAIVTSDNKNVMIGSTVQNNNPAQSASQVKSSNLFTNLINSIKGFFAGLFK